MQRIALAIFALALSVASAIAQTVNGPIPNSGVYGAYNAAPPTCVSGSGCWFQTDINGLLKVAIVSGGGTGGTASSFGAAFPATGTAAGMSQGGNMVALNGLAGNLLVNCSVGCSGGTFNNNADNVATSATNGQSASWGYVWDGAAWDRLYGDSTNGAFSHVKAWGGVALGAPSAYGTSPGAVNVPGVNAFVTNTLAAVGNNADAVAAGAGAASPTVNYNYDFNGTTWDRRRAASLNPCETVAQTYAPILMTTATTLQVAAASASNKTYICSLFLKASAADNVALVEGTGGSCVTGIAGVIGGTTAANGFVFGTAGDGVMLQSGGKTAVAQTAGTNVGLCLITSTTGPLIGGIKYVQAP